MTTPIADDLPAVIQRYLTAHDAHDTDAALATFERDAVVIDDGHEHRGSEAIRSWLSTAASEFTYTRTHTGSERVGVVAWVSHNRLDGNFPGGSVDLAYKFTLTGDRISELVIAP